MNKTILVIEDDRMASHLLKRILEPNNFKVIIVEKIQEALDAIGKNQIDLILLDLFLYSETGSEFLRQRNDHPVLKSIPVIVCTSDSTSRTVQRIAKMRIQDYILKPVAKDILLKKVNNVLLKPQNVLEILK